MTNEEAKREIEKWADGLGKAFAVMGAGLLEAGAKAAREDASHIILPKQRKKKLLAYAEGLELSARNLRKDSKIDA